MTQSPTPATFVFNLITYHKLFIEMRTRNFRPKLTGFNAK